MNIFYAFGDTRLIDQHPDPVPEIFGWFDDSCEVGIEYTFMTGEFKDKTSPGARVTGPAMPFVESFDNKISKQKYCDLLAIWTSVAMTVTLLQGQYWQRVLKNDT